MKDESKSKTKNKSQKINSHLRSHTHFSTHQKSIDNLRTIEHKDQQKNLINSIQKIKRNKDNLSIPKQKKNK